MQASMSASHRSSRPFMPIAELCRMVLRRTCYLPYVRLVERSSSRSNSAQSGVLKRLKEGEQAITWSEAGSLAVLARLELCKSPVWAAFPDGVRA